MNQFEIGGTVTKIHEVQTFSKGFTKRDFVVTTEDKYPQLLKFECVKERMALLDRVREGDKVIVQFRLRGSEYNGKVFVNLQAYGLTPAGGGEGGEAAGPDGDRLPREPEAEDDADAGGNMPF
jgi:single-strand DNA-binding protein